MVEVMAYIFSVAVITNVVAMLMIAAKTGATAAGGDMARSQMLERLIHAFRDDAHAAASVTAEENALVFHVGQDRVRYASDQQSLMRTTQAGANGPEQATLRWPLPSHQTMQWLVDQQQQWAEMRLMTDDRLVWRVVAQLGRNATRGWSEP